LNKATNVGGAVSTFGVPSFASSTGEGIIPGTRGEYEDEYVLGFEREISHSMVLKVRYTDRRLKRIIEDIGTQSPEGSLVAQNYNGGIANPNAKTDIGINEQETTYAPGLFIQKNGAALNSATGLTPANYTPTVPGCFLIAAPTAAHPNATLTNDTGVNVGGDFVKAGISLWVVRALPT